MTQTVTCAHCGQPIIPCPVPGCKVRCLHTRPKPPTRRRPCTGWRHADQWHFCEQGGTPRHLRAEPAGAS